MVLFSMDFQTAELNLCWDNWQEGNENYIQKNYTNNNNSAKKEKAERKLNFSTKAGKLVGEKIVSAVWTKEIVSSI